MHSKIVNGQYETSVSQGTDYINNDVNARLHFVNIRIVLFSESFIKLETHDCFIYWEIGAIRLNI